jgi:hypothetical protein
MLPITEFRKFKVKNGAGQKSVTTVFRLTFLTAVLNLIVRSFHGIVQLRLTKSGLTGLAVHIMLFCTSRPIRE